MGRIEGSTSTELGPVTAFAGVLDGTIYWEAVEVDADGKLSSVEKYLEKIDGGFSDGDLGERQLIGSKQLNQWNYKETITSTFEWDTLKCEKCVRSQQCSKTGNPLFGNKYCKKWADENNTCTTTQF